MLQLSHSAYQRLMKHTTVQRGMCTCKRHSAFLRHDHHISHKHALYWPSVHSGCRMTGCRYPLQTMSVKASVVRNRTVVMQLTQNRVLTQVSHSVMVTWRTTSNIANDCSEISYSVGQTVHANKNKLVSVQNVINHFTACCIAGNAQHCISCGQSICLSSVVPNVVSFAASIAELAHADHILRHSLSHSPSLFDVPGTKAFAS